MKSICDAVLVMIIRVVGGVRLLELIAAGSNDRSAMIGVEARCCFGSDRAVSEPVVGAYIDDPAHVGQVAGYEHGSAAILGASELHNAFVPGIDNDACGRVRRNGRGIDLIQARSEGHAVAAGNACAGQERYLGQLAKALRRALGWRGIFTERREDEGGGGQ